MKPSIQNVALDYTLFSYTAFRWNSRTDSSQTQYTSCEIKLSTEQDVNFNPNICESGFVEATSQAYTSSMIPLERNMMLDNPIPTEPISAATAESETTEMVEATTTGQPTTTIDEYAFEQDAMNFMANDISIEEDIVLNYHDEPETVEYQDEPEVTKPRKGNQNKIDAVRGNHKVFINGGKINGDKQAVEDTIFDLASLLAESMNIKILRSEINIYI